jgi:hypothetical protein
MRKWATAVLLVAVLFLVGAWPGEAGGRGGHRGGFHGHHKHGFRSSVVIGVGPVWWGPRFYPYYYPYYSYYPYYWGGYYAPPYYTYPAPTVVQEPPVYIQQPAAPEPTAYWYYCQSAQAYYPTAPSCSEAWIKVAPRTP